MAISLKKRKDSFFGLHFDYHATPKDGLQGATLSEETVRRICRAVKPDFIQIDCKGHPGWASYPSEIGNALPEFEKDTLALWRRVTREEGVALYMHYSGVYDIKYCREHPDQNVIQADGEYAHGATRTDGTYVDEILIPQLCELAGKYGVDGVWVDGESWKTAADFRPESLAAFEKETGIDLQGRAPATPADPYYDEYREYYREQFRKYLRHYVDAVHEKYPDFQIASNWAFSDHMPEQVSANVDYLSGDLNPYGSLNSARYAARALAQQEGMAWDLMSWNFRIKAGERDACVSKHPSQIMQEAASVIALGGAYQDYIQQFRDGSPDVDEVEQLTALADFLRARKPYCFRATPMHQAALLLSTYDRHRESKRLYSRNGYEKIMGMTALLCDIGQSLEIVCEHTLQKHRDEYGMIVVPELYRGLAPETVADLLDYARKGGSLVLAGRNTCSVFAEGGAPFSVTLKQEFFGEGEKAYDNGGVDNGHGGEMNNHYRNYYFTVDGRACGALFSPCTLSAEGETVAWLRNTPQSESTPIAITVPYGEGQITAVGFDVGSQYLSGTQYLHRTLMRRIADGAYSPIVKIESVVGRLELVVTAMNGKMMLQLVNGGGSHDNPLSASDEYIPPVLDACLALRLPSAPKALILQPEGRELPFTYTDGVARFTVDRINIHSIVEIVE